MDEVRGIWFTLVVLGAASEAGLRASSHDEIARLWAPIFYKDYAHEFTQPDTGFNPVDHPVDIFFDADLDLRNNDENIFTLDHLKIARAMNEPSIYYSVTESTTHYYITYIVYHAVDFKVFHHAHDTENVWTVVEKAKYPGLKDQLVAQISNVHGFPMVHSPNSEREARWRSGVRYGKAGKMFPFIDRYSEAHREGRASYVEREESESIELFIASRSHAIYKADREAWLSGKGSGGIYIPNSCTDCFSKVAVKPGDRIFSYQLVSWDIALKQLQGEATLSAKLPNYLPPGYEEIVPKANLFHTTSFKTPHRLADPIAMHIYFEGSANGIGRSYLYNPYRRVLVKQSHASRARFSF